MKFYVQNPKTKQFTTLNSLPELIRVLEQLCLSIHGVNRTHYMQNLIELGYGYDDELNVTFARAMSEDVNMGIIRNDQYIRCDVHNIERFQKAEYGD
jgi:hypothetical protein